MVLNMGPYAIIISGLFTIHYSLNFVNNINFINYDIYDTP